MSKYFFHITNGKPHDDTVGEELRDDCEAWFSAKRLTRDIEDTEVRDADGPVYEISIAGRKLR
jgi:hypothetical protein